MGTKAKTAKPKRKTSSLSQHEAICALRYENIEKRLDSGSARFIRMELLIYGLYGTIIGTYILERMI